MPDQVVTFGSDETESGDVVLNIRRRDFGRFIESLLGEPRTIEKHYEFSFLIDQNWISHLDSTVMQRLSQNKSKLVDFSCKIYFDSGVIKTLTSREALLTFGDTSNSITVGIQLAWVFLVQFPQVSVPEKQTIRFQAFSDIKYLYESEPPRRILHRVPDSSLGLTSASGLKLLIEHTELTWGEDLFNHINNLIERSVPSKGRAYTYARSFNRLLESGYFILIYFCSVVALVYAQGRDQYSRSIDQIHTAATELDKLPSAIESFSRKLDLYFQHMLDGFSGIFLIGLIKFIALIAILAIASSLAGKVVAILRPGPFVALNTASRNRYETLQRRNSVLLVAVLIGFSVNVLAGIFLNNLIPAIIGGLDWTIGKFQQSVHHPF